MGAEMMGRRDQGQGQLFYEFRLDEAVPDDHLVRKIGALLDLSWVYAEARTLLLGDWPPLDRPCADDSDADHRVRIRHPVGAADLPGGPGNLAYRWFCELGLEDAIPDHSAFSRARNERFRESDIFRRVFECVVASCIQAGLVGGEGFAVDASLIEADANRQRSIPGAEWTKQIDPQAASRAVKEYLATLNDAAFGAATEVQPKFVSPSDPAAQWTGALKGPAFFAYADNYLIDVQYGVVVDVEASRAVRQAEVGAARTMIERTEERFGLKPQRLAADSAYGAAPMLNWLVEEKQIVPHVPVLDRSKREDGTFSREDFRYDESTDTFTCPAGKRLTTTGRINAGDAIFYRSSLVDCAKCELKPRCCPKAPLRRVPRSIYEHARDVARSYAGTDAFERSRHDRKRIEMRFAHLKRILRLGRLRLRGPRGAQDESRWRRSPRISDGWRS